MASSCFYSNDAFGCMVAFLKRNQIDSVQVGALTGMTSTLATTSSKDHHPEAATSKAGRDAAVRTKVYIRNILPQATQTDFMVAMEPWLPVIDYWNFFTGHVRVAFSSKPERCSFAVVNFKDAEALLTFAEAIMGNTGTDSLHPILKGVVIEFAPFQGVPEQFGAPKVDPLAGTLEADDEFRLFKEKVSAEQPKESTPIDSDAMIAKMNAMKIKDVKSTPLVQHLSKGLPTPAKRSKGKEPRQPAAEKSSVSEEKKKKRSSRKKKAAQDKPKEDVSVAQINETSGQVSSDTPPNPATSRLKKDTGERKERPSKETKTATGEGSGAKFRIMKKTTETVTPAMITPNPSEESLASQAIKASSDKPAEGTSEKKVKKFQSKKYTSKSVAAPPPKLDDPSH